MLGALETGPAGPGAALYHRAADTGPALMLHGDTLGPNHGANQAPAELGTWACAGLLHWSPTRFTLLSKIKREMSWKKQGLLKQ